LLYWIARKPKALYRIARKPKALYWIARKQKGLYWIARKPKTIYWIARIELFPIILNLAYQMKIIQRRRVVCNYIFSFFLSGEITLKSMVQSNFHGGNSMTYD
jgi:hypothetical protein